jgi:hypothetical protein
MSYQMKALGSKPARVLWVGTPPLFDGAHRRKQGRRNMK